MIDALGSVQHLHRGTGFRPALAAALAAALLAASSGLSAGAAPTAVVPSVGDVDFVAQQYHDLLSRQVDHAGMDYWVGRLRTGTSRAAMVDELMRSPEFDGVVAPVARLYTAYFGRIPDAAGVSYWVGSLRRGATLSQVSAAFARSTEFVATYGPLDDAHFVTLVYGNVLGRAPDAGGQQFWSGELASGRASRGTLMLAFSESTENKHATAARTTVTTAYLGLLRRAPDEGGLNHWIEQLRRGLPSVDLVGGILSSAEYVARRRAGEWSALETVNGNRFGGTRASRSAMSPTSPTRPPSPAQRSPPLSRRSSRRAASTSSGPATPVRCRPTSGWGPAMCSSSSRALETSRCRRAWPDGASPARCRRRRAAGSTRVARWSSGRRPPPTRGPTACRPRIRWSGSSCTSSATSSASTTSIGRPR